MHSKRIILPMSLFGVLEGFCLGIAFLFLVIVPVEAALKNMGTSQMVINLAMIFVIVLWAMLTLSFALAFYYLILLRPGYTRLAKYILAGLLILDMIAFWWLTSDNAPELRVFNGSTTEQGTIAYGPYPDEKRLEELKIEGYTGVITLISNTIPFEKVLLDREITAGKKLKIPVYSTPMLPWVTSNQEALSTIKELAKAETLKGGKLYIHCYLGRHRVNLVKQVLEENKEGIVELKGFVFPDQVERGQLMYYEKGRIILGAYPSDEEWFNLISRGKIKQVVSYLDPQNPEDLPWIEREKKSCEQLGVQLKLFPIPNRQDNFQAVEELAKYLKNTKGKVYVHGFKVDDRARMLDGTLRQGMVAWRQGKLTGVNTVNYNVLLGPQPDALLSEELNQWGVTSRAKVDLKAATTPAQLANQLENKLTGHKGVFYYYGFSSSQQITQVGKIMRARFYGLDPAAFSKNFGEGKVEIISNLLVVGPLPENPEVSQIGGAGVKTMILLTGRGNLSTAKVSTLSEWAKAVGLKVVTVAYREGYEDDVIKQISQDNNPCYLAVEAGATTQISTDLRAVKLY